MDKLGQAKIVITNFHAFLRREKIKAGKLTKDLLQQGPVSPFTESDGEMVRRVCRALGTKKNIIVINDEAHHCYRRRAGDDRRKSHRRRSQGGRKAKRKRPASGSAGWRPSKTSSASRRLRPLGDALLPARVGLWRGQVVSLGRVGLLPDRRHRVRHRQGAARPRGRRFDDRRTAHLPRPLAADSRRLAEKGAEDRRGFRRAETARGPGRCDPEPLRQLCQVLCPLGGQHRGPQQRPHPAGVHRRLQQHERIEDGLRLHRRLGKAAPGRSHR